MMSMRPWVTKGFPVWLAALTTSKVLFYESCRFLLSPLWTFRFPFTVTPFKFYNKMCIHYIFSDCSRPLLTKIRIDSLSLGKEKYFSECSDVSEHLNTNSIYSAVRLWACPIVSCTCLYFKWRSGSVSLANFQEHSESRLHAKGSWAIFVCEVENKRYLYFQL